MHEDSVKQSLKKALRLPVRAVHVCVCVCVCVGVGWIALAGHGKSCFFFQYNSALNSFGSKELAKVFKSSPQ